MDSDSNPTASANNSRLSRYGAERSKRHGLTIVYTGNGKGKTMAAIGLVIRAAGKRMRVFFLQFIKGQWKGGEGEVLNRLPGIRAQRGVEF